MTNDNPATSFINIVPADGVRIGSVAGLWCNSSGTLRLLDADGNAGDFTVAQGQVIPCSPRSVQATGTTVTSLVGLSNSR
jgi:hypothetical protein